MRPRILFLSAAMIGVSGQALADGDRAQFRLEGEIPKKCEFRFLADGSGTGGGTAVLGELNGAFNKEIPFTLNCNVPVKYSVRAGAGVFRHKGFGRGVVPVAGFRVEQGYRVRLHIPNFDGGDVLSVPEGALTGGKTAVGDSGDSVPYEATGTVIVSKGTASGGVLIAGPYDDILTVTIEPKG